MVFNVLCSNRVHRLVPIHLVYQRFHAFGVVAHCFCSVKRCCKACNCAYMTIWITICKGWKMRKMWPFKVGGLKITKKNLLYIWKCMKVLAHLWANSPMWTDAHYLPTSLGWMIYKMNRIFCNNIHLCVHDKKNFKQRGYNRWTSTFDCSGNLNSIHAHAWHVCGRVGVLLKEILIMFSFNPFLSPYY